MCAVTGTQLGKNSLQMRFDCMFRYRKLGPNDLVGSAQCYFGEHVDLTRGHLFIHGMLRQQLSDVIGNASFACVDVSNGAYKIASERVLQEVPGGAQTKSTDRMNISRRSRQNDNSSARKIGSYG